MLHPIKRLIRMSDRLGSALRETFVDYFNLLQEFSSDSSLQSGFPLQKSSLSIHSPFPQDNFPSGQTGSSVFKMGSIFLGSVKVLNDKKCTNQYRVYYLYKSAVQWWVCICRLAL